MSRFSRLVLASAAAAALLPACASGPSPGPGPGPGASSSPMSFFVTSANPGQGADLGGLAGADRHCQALAASAGAGGKTWRAYLSATSAGGSPAVNARDRIGRGPWQNANGVMIASSVDELHGENKLSKQTAVTEKGAPVNGRGDTPNTHDILTGSLPDGRVSTAAGDTTCGNWTKSGEGSAIVGHHDRMGLDEQPPAKSWNSSHPSRGCGMDALKSSGGGGLLYCFAAN
ncbi:MAG TPA: hypothetical protein VLJ58_18785 [Ramlibacter sp.]|nr:hypothetical protein [Ramlibacter sp.]